MPYEILNYALYYCFYISMDYLVQNVHTNDHLHRSGNNITTDYVTPTKIPTNVTKNIFSLHI